MYTVIVVGGQGQAMETHEGLTEGEMLKTVTDLLFKRLVYAVNAPVVTISVINTSEIPQKKEN